MTEREFFDGLLVGWFVLAAIVFVILQFLSAPYGRHARDGWGPKITSLTGWLIMELPAVATIAICFALGDRHGDPAAIALLVVWQIHYVNRAFIYPFRMRGRTRPMPLLVALLGASTNIAVGYLNGRWLFEFGPKLGAAWLTDPRFLIGVALFFGGFWLNNHADAVLRKLRKPGETDYAIPRGWAYRWVSCPNYLGELIEWLGFALAAWSLPGLAFAVWTASNLAPRARTNHAWYREKFSDYPPQRKALIPFVY